jgi:hypothetical protein
MPLEATVTEQPSSLQLEKSQLLIDRVIFYYQYLTIIESNRRWCQEIERVEPAQLTSSANSSQTRK